MCLLGDYERLHKCDATSYVFLHKSENKLPI